MILERISNTLSKENGNSNLVRPLFFAHCSTDFIVLILTVKCFSKYSFAELCVNTLNYYIEDTLFKVAYFVCKY